MQCEICIYLLDFEICMLVISFLILLLIIKYKVFLLSNTAVYSYQRNMWILLFKANFPMKFWINIKYSEIYWFRHKHHFPLQHPDSEPYKARFYYIPTLHISGDATFFIGLTVFCSYQNFMTLSQDFIICTHCLGLTPPPKKKVKFSVWRINLPPLPSL